MLTVYHYPNCSTCKKALAWLTSHGVDFKPIHIVDQPPSVKTLEKILNLSDLPLQKLFNTSGELYKSGNYKERLKTMSQKEALAELAAHGKLIKRPLVLGADFALVGFKEDDYKARFG